MNRVISRGAVLIAVLGATTAGVASAQNGKHGDGYVRSYPPAYVAPAHGHGHHGHGYWRGGRWIAPFVAGGVVAAAVGTSYYYSTPNYGYNNYAAPSYYAPNDGDAYYAAPAYYPPAAANYAAPARTDFDYADANGDGYISYDEAAVYPHWQRNFLQIDRNGDGYLSRDELASWRYR